MHHEVELERITRASCGNCTLAHGWPGALSLFFTRSLFSHHTEKGTHRNERENDVFNVVLP